MSARCRCNGRRSRKIPPSGQSWGTAKRYGQLGENCSVRAIVVSDMTVTRSDSGEAASSDDSSVHPFLASVRDELAGRFISNPPPLYVGDDITFYEAVRRAAGLDPELGLVAWKNHVELRQALEQLHRQLNWALVERLGGKGRAEPWALDADRTERDVIALLEAAADPACPVGAVVIPRPEKRLLPPGVSGVGKFRGAIAAQLAAVRPLHETYGAIIGQMLLESGGPTDRHLLEWAERQPASAEIDHGPLPAKLTRVAGKWMVKYITMAKFLIAVSDDWSSLTDAQAIALLDAFKPAPGALGPAWSEDSELPL